VPEGSTRGSTVSLLHNTLPGAPAADAYPLESNGMAPLIIAERQWGRRLSLAAPVALPAGGLVRHLAGRLESGGPVERPRDRPGRHGAAVGRAPSVQYPRVPPSAPLGGDAAISSGSSTEVFTAAVESG